MTTFWVDQPIGLASDLVKVEFIFKLYHGIFNR